MLTDKERMELLNLRKRVQTQREEIKRLQAELKRYARPAPIGGEENGCDRSD